VTARTLQLDFSATLRGIALRKSSLRLSADNQTI